MKIMKYQNILKSIYKRLCNMKQTSYRAFALTYIFCYIPIIFKIIFSKFSYAAAFLCMSSIFCICGLFYDIGKYFYYRSLHFVTKYNIYENIYKDIDPEYFPQVDNPSNCINKDRTDINLASFYIN